MDLEVLRKQDEGVLFNALLFWMQWTEALGDG